jgi:hypothetical protein
MSSPTSTVSDPPSKTSDPLVPQTSTMTPANRSRGRNIHIYDANDPTAVLGGLRLTNGITNANFYSMVEILIIPIDDFSLQDESYFFLRDEGNTKIERDNYPLLPGKYYIVATGGCIIAL